MATAGLVLSSSVLYIESFADQACVEELLEVGIDICWVELAGVFS
jgi:hypothetical protein